MTSGISAFSSEIVCTFLNLFLKSFQWSAACSFNMCVSGILGLIIMDYGPQIFFFPADI